MQVFPYYFYIQTKSVSHKMRNSCFSLHMNFDICQMVFSYLLCFINIICWINTMIYYHGNMCNIYVCIYQSQIGWWEEKQCSVETIWKTFTDGKCKLIEISFWSWKKEKVTLKDFKKDLQKIAGNIFLDLYFYMVFFMQLLVRCSF